MEVLPSQATFDIQRSKQPPKRADTHSCEDIEPTRKRRLMSADSFCFSLEDLNSRLYSKHDINSAQEEESLYEDDFCFWCDAKRYQGSFKCPYHANQPTKQNKQEEKANKPYAYQNIPNMLQLYSISTPSGVRTGVTTVQKLPAGAWIGPYEGRLVTRDEAPLKNDYMWEIFKDGKLDGYIDGSDENKSSWMRFIRRASYQEQQNLWAFQYQDKIFYRASKTINPGQELMVWYDQQYTRYTDKEPRNDLQAKNGDQPKQASIPSWPSPIKLATQQPTISKSTPERAGNYQMETTFTRIGALVASPTKLARPSAFPELSSDQTQTVPTKPVPRVSTGFSLKISDGKFAGQNETDRHPSPRIPSVSSPTSPSTPTSNDSGFSFESVSADSPSKSESNQTIWRCGQCNKTFAQRAMLQVHVCVNSPFKPFRCGHCDRSFTTAGEMRAHAVIHQGKKPFKCGYCARSFTGATTLNNHIRIHTGQKPFKCEKCGKNFSQGSQLSKHEKIPGDCVPRKL